MIYDVDDRVRVMINGDLKNGHFIITSVSDDEEIFDLEHITTGDKIIGASRDEIMEEWEIDKAVIALAKSNIFEVDEFEPDEDEEEFIAPDATLDGLAMNFNSFSTIDSLNAWWKMYVDYIEYDKTNDTYHVITKNM